MTVPLPDPHSPVVGQRPVPEGWPVEPAAVELSAERGPMALYADPHGPGFVQIPTADLVTIRAAIAAAHTRPPAAETRGPLLDPMAQRMVGAGALGAGAGWGASVVLDALASSTTGLLLALAILLVLRFSARARGGDTYTTHIHQKWLGKATTNNR